MVKREGSQRSHHGVATGRSVELTRDILSELTGDREDGGEGPVVGHLRLEVGRPPAGRHDPRERRRLDAHVARHRRHLVLVLVVVTQAQTTTTTGSS